MYKLFPNAISSELQFNTLKTSQAPDPSVFYPEVPALGGYCTNLDSKSPLFPGCPALGSAAGLSGFQFFFLDRELC